MRHLNADEPLEEKDREAELVAGFRSGDEEVLAELIRQHQAALFSFVYRHLMDQSEAADIVSQTFVNAWKSRERFRRKAKLKTWLFKIASNLCRDWARRRKRHPADFAAMQAGSEEAGDLAAVQLTDNSDSASETIRREESQMLHQAIAELPHDLRNAVVLCMLEGYSQREAGQLLECSVKTVEMRVYHARRKLKAKLKGKLGD